MNRVVAPSKTDYFAGTPTSGKLTLEQVNAMESPRFRAKLLAFRKKGGIQEYVVTRMIDPESIEGIARRRHFPCPVVAMTKDGKRCCVIAPNGMEMWETMK